MDLLLVVFLPTEKAYEYESDHRSNEHYLNSSENKALFTVQEVFITAKIAFLFISYPQFTYIIFINLQSAPILSGLHL